MHLDKAIKEAFNKANPKQFPIFKKKFKSIYSFRYPQGFAIEGKRIFRRLIKGAAKNVTVTRKGRHWSISMQTEIEIAEPVHPSISIV